MAIDQTSEATTYRDILAHLGHKIVAVMYGAGFMASVAIECETCGCVLLSAEREEALDASKERAWKAALAKLSPDERRALGF